MSPYAAPRPCSIPLCPKFKPCPVHGARPWEHGRPNSADRGYGHRWRKLRDFILARDQHCCVPCRAEGRITPATHVDHIVPKAQGGTDDETNLRSICKRHHDSKSGREGREARR